MDRCNSLPARAQRQGGTRNGLSWVLPLFMMVGSLNGGDARALALDPHRDTLSVKAEVKTMNLSVPDTRNPNICTDIGTNSETGTVEFYSYLCQQKIKRQPKEVSFFCPSARCQTGNCQVAYRSVDSAGNMIWKTYDPKQVTLTVTSSGKRLVTLTIQHQVADTPDLWCFTSQQLERDPECSEYGASFQFVPGQIPRCYAEEGEKHGRSLPILHEGGPSVSSNLVQLQPKTNPNSAMELMVDYARERNLTNCWLCQNMPKSMYSPMFTPIPFSLADYQVINWNNLAPRMEKNAKDCYSSSYPTLSTDFSRYRRMAETAVVEINKNSLPVGVNVCRLLHINAVQTYTEFEMKYKMSLTLVQTNCSESSLSLQCVPQPYTSSVIADVVMGVQPWFGTMGMESVKLNIHNCSIAISTEQTALRDCSRDVPPIQVHALQNVSLCFQGVGRASEGLGYSNCVSVVPVVLRRTSLPERVYLVCGDRAFSCMPYSTLHGVCYLAYLVPMIREVGMSELALLHGLRKRHKREISQFQQVAGILLPGYGIYLSHKEIMALTKVLENHLNASSRAMLAENKELQEVKTVALQNRMALDLLLAAQGGTCEVIGTECCSYISDATSEVMDMIHDTAQGIRKLHERQGIDFGDFSGLFGSWGAGLVKLLVLVLVVALSLIVLIGCITSVCKCVVKRATNTVVQQVPQIMTESPEEEWIPPMMSDDESIIAEVAMLDTLV